MQKRKWLAKLDYLFITRPMLFFPGWNTLLAGYLNSIDDVHLFSDAVEGTTGIYLWNFELSLVMIVFMLAMGGSFILNQLADIESDQKNQKLFLINKNFLSRKSATSEAVMLILISLGLAFFTNFKIFVMTSIFLFITAYLYNFKPFQLKNKPFSGLLLNSLMGWIAFVLGWCVRGDFNLPLILASLPYLFLNTSLYLLTTVPDMSGDRSSDKKTFSVVFGLRYTILLAGILYLLCLMTAIILNDQIILLISLLLVIYFLKLIKSSSLSAVIKFIKMAIFFFSVLICIKFPLYLAVMVSVYFFTRYYYRQRFDYDYPNFRGK